MTRRVVKEILGVHFVSGGVAHSGWLPSTAATPPPTPVVHRTLALKIETDEKTFGYFLIVESDDHDFCWDSWHQSVEEAMEQARLEYGVEQGQWLSPDN